MNVQNKSNKNSGHAADLPCNSSENRAIQFIFPLLLSCVVAAVSTICYLFWSSPTLYCEFHLNAFYDVENRRRKSDTASLISYAHERSGVCQYVWYTFFSSSVVDEFLLYASFWFPFKSARERGRLVQLKEKKIGRKVFHHDIFIVIFTEQYRL